MPFFLNLEDDFKQKVSFDSSLKIASKEVVIACWISLSTAMMNLSLLC